MLKRGIHATKLHDLPSRFAIIPRYGSADEIKWFEASPTYCLHWNNAYENGDEIILEGYFQENPEPGNYDGAPKGLERMMAFLDNHLLQPKLHRWRFNLATGKTIEERLDDKVLEDLEQLTKDMHAKNTDTHIALDAYERLVYF